jgi:hypothetical protein
MKQLSQRARTLGLALTIAASVLSLSAMQVSAQDDRPVDPGVRCAAKLGPGEYEFYMPGAKVTDVNGNKWVCGPDGQWFRDYSAIRGTFSANLFKASLVYKTAALAP